MKIRYNKPYKSNKDLIDLLKKRGLYIDDNDCNYINNIGYYRLSGYFYVFLKDPKQEHIFKNKTEFKNIINTYKFDRKLRLLLFGEIEKIEISFRTKIIDFITQNRNGDIYWYKNYLYENELQKIIKNNGKTKFIESFHKKYEGDLPVWHLFQILTFGKIYNIFKSLPQKEKMLICNDYKFSQLEVFENYISNIIRLRNKCAHHERIWNDIGDEPKKSILLNNIKDLNKIFSKIILVYYFSLNLIFDSNMLDKLSFLIKKYNPNLEYMGFYDWENILSNIRSQIQKNEDSIFYKKNKILK